MAAVELATVAAPNGRPWMVRTMANISSVPAPMYPAKQTKKKRKHSVSTFLRSKVSTTKPLKGRTRKVATT